jgi:hypothetical protein
VIGCDWLFQLSSTQPTKRPLGIGVGKLTSISKSSNEAEFFDTNICIKELFLLPVPMKVFAVFYFCEACRKTCILLEKAR